MRIFFFFFFVLITIISASTISIGSCLKYSTDGQSCQLCIPNYHLNDGLCYVDILGCSQYQFGNICHQCQKNYILVNNMCCDMVCMSKIFSKFKKQIKKEVIQNNTEILSQLIPYVQKSYLRDSSGRLVAIQVNDYEQATRFFLLYQFYESQIHSKRLIVDYVIKSKKFIIVDWTQAKNSWNFGNVQWTQVQDDTSIILLYPNLYPSGHNYSQIVARKAVLSQVNQYEVATRDGSQMLLLVLYVHGADQVILKTVNQIIVKTQEKFTSNSTENTTAKSESSVNTSVTETIAFSPYQLKYKGQEINAQLDVNEPLIFSIDVVKADEGWKSQTYLLTLVIQTGKIVNVIQFTIIGQNKLTGSVIKYEVTFNKPTSQAFITSVDYQTIQIQVVQKNTTPSTVNSTNSSNNTAPTVVQTVDMIQNNIYVVEQGSTTHTIYEAPLSPQMQLIANQLKEIKQHSLPPTNGSWTNTTQNSISTNSSAQAPFISYVPPGLTFRRLVVSQFCQDSPYRQIAYVQANTTSKSQYFTYYFEVNDPNATPNKTWYPLGDKNKNQTQYWNTVSARSLAQIDPSFSLPPLANLSQQSNVFTSFYDNLTTQDQAILNNLQAVQNTEVNRNMGAMKRFAVNYEDSEQSYRGIGFQMIDTIPNLHGSSMISIFCPMNKITESLFISSKGPTSNTSNTLTVKTTVSTNVLGDQTVKTIDVQTFLTNDQILRQILAVLKLQKPIISGYQLKEIKIAQFNQALQYHLKFSESNFNNQTNFTCKSTINTVVVHEKQTSKKNIITFQIIQLLPLPDTNTTQTKVHSSVTPIQNQYVLIDTKTQQDYTLHFANSTTQNNTTTSIDSANQTSTGSTDFTPTTEKSSTNHSSAVNTSSTGNSTSSAVDNSIQNQIKLIQKKQRISQIFESIMQQLETTYNLTSPKIIQALQKVVPEQKIIKINLIVEDHNQPPMNYTVDAIAPLNNQNDPIIESVKPVSAQIIQKLTPSPTTDRPKACQNLSVNTQGQQVGNDETSSGETDIIPTNSSGTSTNNTGSINYTTPSPSSNSTSNATTSQPSTQLLQLVEDKSYQQTTQVDGQVRGLYMNPQLSGLDANILQIVNLAVKSLQLFQSTDSANLTVKQSKVVGIQIAATGIYTHYAITIKTVYLTTVIIRRYYFIRSPLIIDMGVQNLAYPYDLKLPQNRAFKNLLTHQMTNQTHTTYENALNVINRQTKIVYIITNIVAIRYRTFPTGQYQKVTFKNAFTVANAHLEVKNTSETVLLNWHEAPIQLLVSQVQSPTNQSSTPFGPAQTANSSSTSQSTNKTTDSSSPVSNTSLNTNITGTNSTSNNTNTTSNQNSTTPLVQSQIIPQEILNQQQQIGSDQVVISQVLQMSLKQVLQFLSINKSQQLSGCSLQQYAIQEEKSQTNVTITSIKFDLYFVKIMSQILIRQYICSVKKHSDGQIQISIFLSNDIDLTNSTPFTGSSHNTTLPTNISTNSTSTANSTQSSTTPTNSSSNTSQGLFSNTTISPMTNSSTGSSLTTVVQHVVDQQIKLNSNFSTVDPNGINYPQAIALIDEDPQKQDFDQNVNLSNIPSGVQQIIKYLRAKYYIIQNSGILRVVLSTKTTTVQRYRLYFYKQLLTGQYEIYRAILDYSTETPQKKFNILSFQLYVQNNQLVIQPTKISDLSFKDDTDIAYGYIDLDLESINNNSNIQNVLKHIKTKYNSLLTNKKVVRIQELRIFDGRLNYKILFRGNLDQSQFKFIAFYQPLLKKVLILNSVNIPHHSQYNQLSSEQQKSDSEFNSVLSYLNSIHPQLSGFVLRSVTKANQNAYTQYQITIQKNNKKYKSFIRVASNNVDLSEISFSQMIEVSLDHYRLDQFDQMFIMNYQKLSETQIRQNSQIRTVLSFLHNNQKIHDSQFLGAASKPYGLGFLYKVFLMIGAQRKLATAQIYIQSYLEKISLKSYKTIDFDMNLLSINIQEEAVTKIISLIKQKLSYKQLTIRSASAKDFLYGTLYKMGISNADGSIEIFIYHDHSTEQISILFKKFNLEKNQCDYEETICKSCLDTHFRLFDNKCVQSIQYCSVYNGQLCTQCSTDSQRFNGICILKNECGALCQVIQL